MKCHLLFELGHAKEIPAESLLFPRNGGLSSAVITHSSLQQKNEKSNFIFSESHCLLAASERGAQMLSNKLQHLLCTID